MGIIQRDSFKVSIIAYAGAGIGYLNKIFLFPNFLQPDEVGLANLLITISVMYAQFATLGTYNITYRFFPFFNNHSKQHHGFLFGVSGLAMAGFILFTLVFILFKEPFRLYYQDSSPLLIEYYWYIVPLALATLYFHLFDTYLRSLFKNVIPSLIHEVGLRIVITFAVSAYAFGLFDFPTFVCIYVVVNCLPAVVVILYTGYIKQLFMKPVISSLWKRIGKIVLVYGAFTFLNNLSFMVLSSIDSLMVAGFINLESAGIYTTMIFITTVLLIPYRSIIKVSTPLVSGYWKERALAKMEDVYIRASESNIVIGGGLFLLLWVNIDSVFYFMPAEYSAGKWVFLMLGTGRLFDMASGLNGVILLTSRKYGYDLFFTVGLVFFAFISNYFLIPVFGMNGAAFASMITLIAFNVLRILFVYIHFRIQPFLLKMIWVPLLMIAVAFISEVSGSLDNVFADIFIRSIAATVLFAAPVYLLKISGDINQMVKKYI